MAEGSDFLKAAGTVLHLDGVRTGQGQQILAFDPLAQGLLAQLVPELAVINVGKGVKIREQKVSLPHFPQLGRENTPHSALPPVLRQRRDIAHAAAQHAVSVKADGVVVVAQSGRQGAVVQKSAPALHIFLLAVRGQQRKTLFFFFHIQRDHKRQASDPAGLQAFLNGIEFSDFHKNTTFLPFLSIRDCSMENRGRQ